MKYPYEPQVVNRTGDRAVFAYSNRISRLSNNNFRAAGHCFLSKRERGMLDMSRRTASTRSRVEN